MGYRVLLAVLLLASTLPARAQHITRQHADSLSVSLKKERRDINDLYALLQLADFNIQKRGEEKVDLDSAANFIARAKQLNGRLRSGVGSGYISLMEAILDRERKQRAEGKLAVQQAVSLLSKENDAALLGKAYYESSEYYDYDVPAEQGVKIDYVQKSLHCYEQAGVLERQGYCLERLCDLYYNSEQLVPALKCGKLSIERYKAAHYPNLQGPYILLANVYLEEGNYQQAVNYGLLAIQVAKELHDSTMQLCQINYVVGITFSHLNEFAKAQKYVRDAMNIASLYHDTTQTYLCGVNVASGYNLLKAPASAIALLDSIARCYGMPKIKSLWAQRTAVYEYSCELLRNYAKAEIYVDSLLSAYNDPKDLEVTRYNVYFTVMRYFILTSQFSRARDSLPAFRNLVSHMNAEASKSLYQILFMLDTAEHNYRSAVGNIFGYYGLKDSLLNEQKAKQIQELQVEYETSEKEKNIAVLQRESEIQKSAWHIRKISEIFSSPVWACHCCYWVSFSTDTG